MKYVVYYRVSTKKQGKSGLGLESQKAIVSHFVEQQNIIESHTDILSGKDTIRHGLQKAIKKCKEANATLVVAKIDRLSRKTEDARNLYNELEGRLSRCDIPNLEQFTLTIFMAIADRERELISIRTKQALAEIKKQGKPLGTIENLTDQGRREAHKANRLKAMKNENNMRASALIVEMRNKGMQLQQIADKLNSNGFKTSRGNSFYKTSVSRLHDRQKNT
jgi:DNA invertase Pin-like site-specific DNA recombinase